MKNRRDDMRIQVCEIDYIWPSAEAAERWSARRCLGGGIGGGKKNYDGGQQEAVRVCHRLISS
jgi:hypothetical protein